MALAIVSRITHLEPHPNADKLQILTFVTWDGPYGTPAGAARLRLVVGFHYRAGDLGVWLRPGASVPGWLANHLWVIGKKKASEQGHRETVVEKNMRGIISPGLWIGQFYQTDTSAESHDHARELKEHGGVETIRDGQPWITPAYWNSQWKAGDEVDEDLEILPASLEISAG